MNDIREANLTEIFKIIWDGKRLIIYIGVIFSIFAVIFSLFLPNIYRAESILVPAIDSASEKSSIGNVSGLASLAGINIGDVDGPSKSDQAMEKILSLSFFSQHILPHIYLPNLMAYDYWDEKNNGNFYKKDEYDVENEEWIREVSSPFQRIPSPQDAHIQFTKLINISQDDETGFILLSVEHESPSIAFVWSNLIFNEVNKFFRMRDKLEAEESISYLNQQISETNFAEVKQALSELIQTELQKLTLIQSNEDYVFKYIDPPAIEEFKSKPSRALICIFIGILGGLIGITIVLLRHFNFKKY